MKAYAKLSLIGLFFTLVACGNSATTQNTDNPAELTDDKNTATNRPINTAPEGSAKAMFASVDARSIGPDRHEHQAKIDEAHEKIEASRDDLIGYWVGAFGPNIINIAMSETTDSTAIGHSVCAGNYRPINGSLNKESKYIYHFEMLEPGDHKNDGKFLFTIDLAKDSLSGSWIPFKPEGNSAKNYKLTPKKFAYSPEVGRYPQASQRLLEDADVENLLPEDLRIMRNEIYARHGYCFKKKDMRHHFEKEDWYTPLSVDVRKELTDIEVKNIDLIYNYEEYYKENYDAYGR